jgi:carotenoid cleavage dioxygenase
VRGPGTRPLPRLAGNYAPVPDEITACELTVEGTIPPGLNGWYLRNGPNPHQATAGHWFLGDGMVHGVRLENGTAVSYRNRWVRTPALAGSSRAPGEHGTADLAASAANTHVIRHAGHILALEETSFPYELDAGLGTVGPYDFGGRLATAMTAHPKTCPVTGELHFFGYAARMAPYLTYHRADAAGDLVVSRPVTGTGPVMMHDFALTARHVVFMDLPVVFDPGLAGSGTMPYRWDDGYGARLGVLPREDPGGPVRWFNIDPCYVFHVLNAYEEDGRIALTVIRHPDLWRGGPGRTAPEHGHTAVLWRWTIDLAREKVTDEQLDDRPCEFPRIDDRMAGLDARYGYAVTGPHQAAQSGTGTLLRYDLHTGDVSQHDFGPGRIPGEAAFAPADDAPGGAGWLMSYVHDAATDTSDLVILDATDPAARPAATIRLPRRVPYGFHGNWLPDPASARTQPSPSA